MPYEACPVSNYRKPKSKPNIFQSSLRQEIDKFQASLIYSVKPHFKKKQMQNEPHNLGVCICKHLGGFDNQTKQRRVEQ